MERRNRYRTPVRLTSVFRVIFICVLLGLAGGVFVYARNNHVKQGDKIRSLEEQIAALDDEIELWQLRNASSKDRVELVERLKWVGSELQPIDPSYILSIDLRKEAVKK